MYRGLTTALLILLFILISPRGAAAFDCPPQPQIFVNANLGDDTKDGQTFQTAVKAVARAKALLSESDGYIAEVNDKYQTINVTKITAGTEVKLPTTGIALPTSVLYTGLGFITLLLLASGWWLRVKGKQAAAAPMLDTVR